MNNITHLNWIDYSLLGIIGISTIISFMRGFVKEAVSLAIWVLAIVLSFKFAQPLSVLMTSMIHSGTLRYGLAFALIFLAVLIIGIFVNAIVGTLVSKTGISATDRFLGVFFGIARGLLVVSILLMVTNFSSIHNTKMYADSKLAPHFSVFLVWLKGYLPQQLQSVSQWVDSGADSVSKKIN